MWTFLSRYETGVWRGQKPESYLLWSSRQGVRFNKSDMHYLCLVLLFASERGAGTPRYEWTHSPPGSVPNSPAASWSRSLSQDITSAGWQSASWSGFRPGMVLTPGAGRSPPGDVFTVTSSRLQEGSNRWTFSRSPFFHSSHFKQLLSFFKIKRF